VVMNPGNLARAHRLLAPRIAYLIGTRDQHSEPNLIPVSNVTSVSTEPELVLLAVFKEWQTHANLIDTNAFTLSVPRVEHSLGVWKLGARYSRYRFSDLRTKLEGSGLSIEDRADLPGPILRDGLGWMSCSVSQCLDVGGDHGVFIGEVTHVEFDDQYLDAEGLPQIDPHPLMQVTGNQFSTSAESFRLPYGDRHVDHQ